MFESLEVRGGEEREGRADPSEYSLIAFLFSSAIHETMMLLNRQREKASFLGESMTTNSISSCIDTRIV